MKISLASAEKQIEGLQGALSLEQEGYWRMLNYNHKLAIDLGFANRYIAILEKHIEFIEGQSKGLALSIDAEKETAHWFQQQVSAANNDSRQLNNIIYRLRNIAIQKNAARRDSEEAMIKKLKMANKKRSQTEKNLAKLRRKLGKERGEKQAAKAIVESLTNTKELLEKKLWKVQKGAQKGEQDKIGKKGQRSNKAQQLEIEKLREELAEKTAAMKAYKEKIRDMNSTINLLLYKNNIGDNQILARLAELETQLEQEGARRNGFETYLHGYVAELERNTAQLRFRLLANFIDIVELLGRERLQLTVHMLDTVASRLAEATDTEISGVKLNIAVKKVNIYLFEGLLPQPVANTADKDTVNRLSDNTIRLKGDIVELLGGVEEKLGISTDTVAVRRDNTKGLGPASKSKGSSINRALIKKTFDYA
ncbi:hypothetical protein B7494_g5704 [Chlorociboria aeruginascens]|nr:hypothetical protein B7494_g5704 [Chlorociboria aeruginascens]